jgi:hypothetical protein
VTHHCLDPRLACRAVQEPGPLIRLDAERGA